MSRRTSDREYRVTQGAMTAVYLLLIGLLSIASAVADDEVRSSTTKHYIEGGRESTSIPVESADEFAGLITSGERLRPGTAGDAATPDGTPAKARSTSNDYWIYAADVVLFGDDDRDGFFYGIDLLFDVDTVWSSSWVYAVVYLSLDGGPWNEYASTDDFVINGATSDDEYVLVTELDSGYPTGDYDLLIELYDANSGDFLTDFGPESSSELSYLPLEDYHRDTPVRNRPVIVSHGHGGGAAGLGLLRLPGLAVLLRVVRRGRNPVSP